MFFGSGGGGGLGCSSFPGGLLNNNPPGCPLYYPLPPITNLASLTHCNLTV